jgi:hypothetical protein
MRGILVGRKTEGFPCFLPNRRNQHLFETPGSAIKKRPLANIHHHGKANDLRRRFEITERAGFGHSGRLGYRHPDLNRLSSHSALEGDDGYDFTQLAVNKYWNLAVREDFLSFAT